MRFVKFFTLPVRHNYIDSNLLSDHTDDVFKRANHPMITSHAHFEAHKKFDSKKYLANSREWPMQMPPSASDIDMDAPIMAYTVTMA